MCATSLWRKICLSHPDRPMPSIIELWFKASERIKQSGRSLAIVAMPVSFDTYPDVKTSAAALPCRSAISRSSSTMGWFVPEMFAFRRRRYPCGPRFRSWRQSSWDVGPSRDNRSSTRSALHVHRPAHARSRAEIGRLTAPVRRIPGNAVVFDAGQGIGKE